VSPATSVGKASQNQINTLDIKSIVISGWLIFYQDVNFFSAGYFVFLANNAKKPTDPNKMPEQMWQNP